MDWVNVEINWSKNWGGLENNHNQLNNGNWRRIKGRYNKSVWFQTNDERKNCTKECYDTAKNRFVFTCHSLYYFCITPFSKIILK